jgi:hypothetical protein
MTGRYSDAQRCEAALAVFDIDRFWAATFPEGALADLNFCDLFTQVWMRRDTPFNKTDLYAFMPNVSPRTAAKYVQVAIDLGMLQETVAPHDRRVRLVTVSATCSRRVEKFLDFTCRRFGGMMQGVNSG